MSATVSAAGFPIDAAEDPLGVKKVTHTHAFPLHIFQNHRKCEEKEKEKEERRRKREEEQSL